MDRAPQDRDGSKPLLGLEPTTTENTDELGSKPEADSFESSLNPLLGTIFPQASDKLRQIAARGRAAVKLDLARGWPLSANVRCLGLEGGDHYNLDYGIGLQ
jgi:hypothetical protein